jgi:hypothetical protein
MGQFIIIYNAIYIVNIVRTVLSPLGGSYSFYRTRGAFLRERGDTVDWKGLRFPDNCGSYLHHT